ncbi:unnamed protein product [Symbiodinium sp. CCMP2592]|nr:unnamed protein product [Symbiodinium sp. CCMP2592]
MAARNTTVQNQDFDVREHRRKQNEMAQALQSKKKSYKLEDVVQLVLSIHSDGNATREELQRYISLLDRQLSERLQDVVTKLATTQTSVEDNEKASMEQHQKLSSNMDRLHETAMKTAKEFQQSLSNQLSDMHSRINEDMRRHEEKITDLYDKLGLTRRELSANMAVMRSESRVLMHQNNELLTKALKDSEQETREHAMTALQRTKAELKDTQERQAAYFESRMDKADTFAENLAADLDYLSKKVEANRNALEDLVGKASGDFRDREQMLRKEHGNLLDVLDGRATRLDNIIAEVENIPTRKVDWIIKDAAQQIAKLALRSDLVSAPPAWVSPKFEAAGAHSLQMELRFLRPSDVQADQDQDSMAARGDCALALRGDPGLFLVCRLFVGSAFGQIEHTFQDETTAVCSKPICFIRDQINEKDGSLVISFEVLEAIRSVSRYAPARAEANGALGLGGQIKYHRYLNHRMLDIVQDQVDLIRSGMVRRIEWRLERASQLRKCFPENECLCSTTFEAAGVDDLQLVFYPSGYVGAREGFCSFFLHCPAGSMLKCWLSVGKHRREAKCAFEKPGYFGRTNFCRFDNSIDPADDTTMLVLEIDEAQWNIEEPLSHQPMGKVSTVSTKQNTFSDDESKSIGLPLSPEGASPMLDKVDSKLSRQRMPGSRTLQETRQLPSIWTSVPKADVFEALEGYRSFNDLKTPRRPLSTARNTKGGVAWKDPHPQPPQSSRQNPHRYVMYAS